MYPRSARPLAGCDGQVCAGAVRAVVIFGAGLRWKLQGHVGLGLLGLQGLEFGDGSSGVWQDSFSVIWECGSTVQLTTTHQRVSP